MAFSWRLKNYIKSKLGYIATLKTDYKYSKNWYGNEYGGFYINPDLINENSTICIPPTNYSLADF